MCLMHLVTGISITKVDITYNKLSQPANLGRSGFKYHYELKKDIL